MATEKDDLAQGLSDQGFDVYEGSGGLTIDSPNPRTTDDDYFHGANPHTEGFGSRPVAAEGGGQDTTVEPGESTADAQERLGGLGWNAEAGEDPASHTPAQTASSVDAPGGDEPVRVETGEGPGSRQAGGGGEGDGPDESWTNADIAAYAEANGISLGQATRKDDMLEAIRAAEADPAE